MQLVTEAPATLPHRPAADWPAAGAITFQHYTTRYREGLDLVLRDVDAAIQPHEKARP